MSPKENIIVLRHAIYDETHLTEYGILQTEERARQIQSITSNQAIILSSVSERAAETANIIAQILEIPQPTLYQCLSETSEEKDENESVAHILAQEMLNVIVVTHLWLIPGITRKLCHNVVTKKRLKALEDEEINYSEGWHINVPKKKITKIS